MKNLLFHRKQINKATVDLGKAFVEAREVFIKSHSESFVKWYEKLGFNKDQVGIAMNRFQMTIEYPNAKEVIINLSDVAIKEVTSRKNTIIYQGKSYCWRDSDWSANKGRKKKNNSRGSRKISTRRKK